MSGRGETYAFWKGSVVELDVILGKDARGAVHAADCHSVVRLLVGVSSMSGFEGFVRYGADEDVGYRPQTLKDDGSEV